MKKIIIKIDPKKGTVSYEIEGMAGASCTELANVLTAGQRVEEEGHTQAFYLPDEVPVSVEEG